MGNACPNLGTMQIDDVDSVFFAVPKKVTEIAVSVVHPRSVHLLHRLGKQTNQIPSFSNRQRLPNAL